MDDELVTTLFETAKALAAREMPEEEKTRAILEVSSDRQTISIALLHCHGRLASGTGDALGAMIVLQRALNATAPKS